SFAAARIVEGPDYRPSREWPKHSSARVRSISLGIWNRFRSSFDTGRPPSHSEVAAPRSQTHPAYFDLLRSVADARLQALAAIRLIPAARHQADSAYCQEMRGVPASAREYFAAAPYSCWTVTTLPAQRRGKPKQNTPPLPQ